MKSRAFSYLSLLVAISFSIVPAFAQAGASESTTTVQTTETPAAPPVVIDSFMKPVYSRTKEVTSQDGTTEKTVEPMIMERHEKVAIPGAESTTTTVHTEKSVVPVTKSTTYVKSEAKPVVKHRVAHRVHRTHIASRPHPYVAMKTVKQEKLATETHTVVNEEHSVQSPTIIERPDPALGNN